MDNRAWMDDRLKILVVDGNAHAANARMSDAGGLGTGRGFLRALGRVRDDLNCLLINPAEEGAECLPAGVNLSDFDGIVLTGSAYSVYEDLPQIRDQIQLVRKIFPSGRPVLGACYGLQIMALAQGGTVRANPNGVETGLARDIRPTAAGREHPFYAGGRDGFTAVAIHQDEVEQLPDGAVLLASNHMSRVQAMEIRRGESVFWGTQYHPEFDFDEIAPIIRLRSGSLVADGIFPDESSVLDYVENLAALGDPATASAAAQALDVPTGFADLGGRLTEIRVWLETLVVPFAANRR